MTVETIKNDDGVSVAAIVDLKNGRFAVLDRHGIPVSVYENGEEVLHFAERRHAEQVTQYLKNNK
jgi:hypothetical protein